MIAPLTLTNERTAPRMTLWVASHATSSPTPVPRTFAVAPTTFEVSGQIPTDSRGATARSSADRVFALARRPVRFWRVERCHMPGDVCRPRCSRPQRYGVRWGLVPELCAVGRRGDHDPVHRPFFREMFQFCESKMMDPSLTPLRGYPPYEALLRRLRTDWERWNKSL